MAEGKYGPLQTHLEALASPLVRVEIPFSQVDQLIEGLPASARQRRSWWANNSHTQAVAWRRAGWHVHRVDFLRQTVVFARGPVGGPDAKLQGRPGRQSYPEVGRVSEQPPAGTLDARVTFTWRALGRVELDTDGQLSFPGLLPASPGLYRLLLLGGPRARIYIGETDNLRRRLGQNYRRPGPTQHTSLRVNAALTKHLNDGGQVETSIAIEAKVRLNDAEEQELDLRRKAPRLLAESAALVLAQIDGTADIENLG